MNVVCVKMILFLMGGRGLSWGGQWIPRARPPLSGATACKLNYVHIFCNHQTKNKQTTNSHKNMSYKQKVIRLRPSAAGVNNKPLLICTPQGRSDEAAVFRTRRPLQTGCRLLQWERRIWRRASRLRVAEDGERRGRRLREQARQKGSGLGLGGKPGNEHTAILNQVQPASVATDKTNIKERERGKEKKKKKIRDSITEGARWKQGNNEMGGLVLRRWGCSWHGEVTVFLARSLLEISALLTQITRGATIEWPWPVKSCHSPPGLTADFPDCRRQEPSKV